MQILFLFKKKPQQGNNRVGGGEEFPIQASWFINRKDLREKDRGKQGYFLKLNNLKLADIKQA
jgi:hypothetical protein